MCTSRQIPYARELTGPARPWRLLDLRDPPPRLLLYGELPRGPSVAIVGTRHPTTEAESYARQLAAELAASGVAILSGGAEGIDAAAHQGALDVGGHTVVVAPAGIERPYPEQHAELFDRVLRAGGAYLCACDPDTPADYAAFFGRNAIMAALADALVVVEAPVRSGARTAALNARKLGRPLFVVPAPPWNPRGLGCIVELKLGARPLFSARDLLAALAARRLHPIAPSSLGAPSLRARAEGEHGPAATRRSKAGRAGQTAAQLDLPSIALHGGILPAEAARVRCAVEQGAACVDAVCAGAGLELRRVQHVIAVLVSSGVLLMEPDGRLRLPA